MKLHKKMIMSIIILSIVALTFAGKIPYIQLAHKDGVFRKHISLSKIRHESLIADGWTMIQFYNESDIPLKPVLDNGTVREMTAVEITAAETAVKLSRTIFNFREILYACDALNLRDKLNTIISNDEFKLHLIGAGGIVDLNDTMTIQALSSFTTEEINNIKLKIGE